MTKRLTAEDVAAKNAANKFAWYSKLSDDWSFNPDPDSGVIDMKKRKKPAPKRKPKMRESEVLRGCIAILDSHPRIAMWWRQNTGAVKVDGKRSVRFSFKGASDLMGVIKGGECAGKFLAVECKATGKKAKPEQAAFLDNVLDAGGWAVCVDDPLKLSFYLKALL